MGHYFIIKNHIWKSFKNILQLYAFKIKWLKNNCIIERGLYAYNIIKYVSLGHSVKLKKNFRIECYPSFAGEQLIPSLSIGNNVIINYGFTAFVADTITIGANSILAANVTFISENHGINPESEKPYYAQPLSHGPISVGSGCWLGQNVTVLPGVTIGDKCIIGANSVVTKDIPSFSIAVGSPAKVIKRYSFESHSWDKVL